MKLTQSLFFQLSLVIVVAAVSFSLGYFLKSGGAQQEGDQLYAIVNGEKIFGRDVISDLTDELADLQRAQYNLKKSAVMSLIERKAMEKLKDQGEESEPDFNQEEFDKFLKDRNLNLAKMNDRQKEDIRGNFRMHKIMLARKEKTQQAIQSQSIQWFIPIMHLGSPLEVDSGSLPNIGGSGGKGTLVVFGNYHCPYCNQIPRKVAELQKLYDNNLKVHFRFSMAEPQQSVVFQSAVLAYCAHQQNKFPEVHKALFEKPPLSAQDLQDFVSSSGLDREKFSSCVQSDKTIQTVMADTEFATAHSFNGEAVIFTNGYKIPVQETLDVFESVLNRP